MAYIPFNGTEMGNDLTYLIKYADDVTGGWTSISITLAFFFVVLIGSLLWQKRSIGQMVKPESSFLIASFVTLGFELIMMQSNLINGWWFAFTLFITLLSFLWVLLDNSEGM